MHKETNFLDITLLGKEYRVACPPEDHEALRVAVVYVDEKMHDIAEKTRNNISERIAVMAALNIAHEYLSQKSPTDETNKAIGSETAVDFGAVKRRISVMEAELDTVLTPQE